MYSAWPLRSNSPHPLRPSCAMPSLTRLCLPIPPPPLHSQLITDAHQHLALVSRRHIGLYQYHTFVGLHGPFPVYGAALSASSVVAYVGLLQQARERMLQATSRHKHTYRVPRDMLPQGVSAYQLLRQGSAYTSPSPTAVGRRGMWDEEAGAGGGVPRLDPPIAGLGLDGFCSPRLAGLTVLGTGAGHHVDMGSFGESFDAGHLDLLPPATMSTHNRRLGTAESQDSDGPTEAVVDQAMSPSPSIRMRARSASSNHAPSSPEGSSPEVSSTRRRRGASSRHKSSLTQRNLGLEQPGGRTFQSAAMELAARQLCRFGEAGSPVLREGLRRLYNIDIQHMLQNVEGESSGAGSSSDSSSSSSTSSSSDDEV